MGLGRLSVRPGRGRARQTCLEKHSQLYGSGRAGPQDALLQSTMWSAGGQAGGSEPPRVGQQECSWWPRLETLTGEPSFRFGDHPRRSVESQGLRPGAGEAAGFASSSPIVGSLWRWQRKTPKPLVGLLDTIIYCRSSLT
ncbi:hypothetical protein NDU88_007961 [Pleurodeles waltl]|uniref:Uncharacterized protein n=1 Tax=Pleurodeles waltl TaxID=8319 RepID=A0AAV7N3K2_PLEWA|nr:hypothetical protein NDU88_007961 [Pleurodeles waltl]